MAAVVSVVRGRHERGSQVVLHDTKAWNKLGPAAGSNFKSENSPMRFEGRDSLSAQLGTIQHLSSDHRRPHRTTSMTCVIPSMDENNHIPLSERGVSLMQAALTVAGNWPSSCIEPREHRPEPMEMVYHKTGSQIQISRIPLCVGLILVWRAGAWKVQCMYPY